MSTLPSSELLVLNTPSNTSHTDFDLPSLSVLTWLPEGSCGLPPKNLVFILLGL